MRLAHWESGFCFDDLRMLDLRIYSVMVLGHLAHARALLLHQSLRQLALRICSSVVDVAIISFRV